MTLSQSCILDAGSMEVIPDNRWLSLGTPEEEVGHMQLQRIVRPYGVSAVSNFLHQVWQYAAEHFEHCGHCCGNRRVGCREMRRASAIGCPGMIALHSRCIRGI